MMHGQNHIKFDSFTLACCINSGFAESSDKWKGCRRKQWLPVLRWRCCVYL